MTEQEEKLQQISDVILRVADDMSVPRNIRRAAKAARKFLLETENDPVLKASSAISTLNEVIDDPNMPVHARTVIWDALSKLETVRE